MDRRTAATRSIVCSVLAGTVLLLGAVPAAAHGGSDTAYRSTVSSISPATGFAVTVLDGDDRLQLTRAGDVEIIVFGYEQEPYLRFTSSGVFRNDRSPATYLNDDRLGNVALPSTADANAPPVWTKVADGATYDWHDHRIHWMGTAPPPAVQRNPGHAQELFSWTVPLTVAGAAGRIDGQLDYTPQPDNPWPLLFFAASVLALVAIAGGSLVRNRIRASRPSAPRSR